MDFSDFIPTATMSHEGLLESMDEHSKDDVTFIPGNYKLF